MTEGMLLVVESLGAILLLVVGWNVKQVVGRLMAHEKETARKFEIERERHDNDIKSLYKHHDNRSDSLRKDINALAESLRSEISKQADKTNTILLELASK